MKFLVLVLIKLVNKNKHHSFSVGKNSKVTPVRMPQRSKLVFVAVIIFSLYHARGAPMCSAVVFMLPMTLLGF